MNAVSDHDPFVAGQKQPPHTIRGAIVRLVLFVPLFLLLLWVTIELATQDELKHPHQIPYAIMAFLLILPIGICCYSLALHIRRRVGKVDHDTGG